MSKQSKATVVPAGMRRITSGDFPPFFDFEKRKALLGKVISLRKMTVTRGKGKKAVTRKVGVVSIADQKTGEIFSVGESAALTGFFKEVKKGNKVYIKFLGKKQISKGQNPMRLFESYIG